MSALTTAHIKTCLRIMHDKLDAAIEEDIKACLNDLALCGFVYADETDPLMLNAIKLWCQSFYTDDVVKSAEYLKRYNALKSCLMMAEGYGRPLEDKDE